MEYFYYRYKTPNAFENDELYKNAIEMLTPVGPNLISDNLLNALRLVRDKVVEGSEEEEDDMELPAAVKRKATLQKEGELQKRFSDAKKIFIKSWSESKSQIADYFNK